MCICMCICMCAWMYVCMYVCTYVRMHSGICMYYFYTHLLVYVDMFVCIYFAMYMCTFVHVFWFPSQRLERTQNAKPHTRAHATKLDSNPSKLLALDSGRIDVRSTFLMPEISGGRGESQLHSWLISRPERLQAYQVR